MKMPTEEQLRRGRRVADEMFDASIARALNQDMSDMNFEFKDIIHLYIHDEIDTVTGIYLAMQN